MTNIEANITDMYTYLLSIFYFVYTGICSFIHDPVQWYKDLSNAPVKPIKNKTDPPVFSRITNCIWHEALYPSVILYFKVRYTKEMNKFVALNTEATCTIILVHGLCGSRFDFYLLLDAISTQMDCTRIQFITCELEAQASLQSDIENFRNSLSQYSNQKLYLFGHSRGGKIIQETIKQLTQNRSDILKRILGYTSIASPEHGAEIVNNAKLFLTGLGAAWHGGSVLGFSTMLVKLIGILKLNQAQDDFDPENPHIKTPPPSSTHASLPPHHVVCGDFDFIVGAPHAQTPPEQPQQHTHHFPIGHMSILHHYPAINTMCDTLKTVISKDDEMNTEGLGEDRRIFPT